MPWAGLAASRACGTGVARQARLLTPSYCRLFFIPAPPLQKRPKRAVPSVPGHVRHARRSRRTIPDSQEILFGGPCSVSDTKPDRLQSIPSLPQSTIRLASAGDQGPLNPVANLGAPRTSHQSTRVSPGGSLEGGPADLSRLAFVSENLHSVSRETCIGVQSSWRKSHLLRPSAASCSGAAGITNCQHRRVWWRSTSTRQHARAY